MSEGGQPKQQGGGACTAAVDRQTVDAAFEGGGGSESRQREDQYQAGGRTVTAMVATLAGLFLSSERRGDGCG